MRAPLSSMSNLRESHEKRFELQLRLLKLACGIGVGHHPDARVQPCAILPQETAPQGYRELAIAATVDPPDRTRIPTTLEAFQLVDEGIRRRARPAPDRGRRVEGGGQVKRFGMRFGQLCRHGRGKVL